MAQAVQVDPSFNLEQCRAIVQAYSKRVDELQSEKRNKDLEELRARARELNLTTKELQEIGLAGGKPGKGVKGPKESKRVEPKYVSPDGAQKWAGRGVKPVWVRQHLDAGGSLDDLLISKA